MGDQVNHPSHYQGEGIECIDAMVAAFGPTEVGSFCKLNAFKYIWRSNNKGNCCEDMQKAEWYLHKFNEIIKDERLR